MTEINAQLVRYVASLSRLSFDEEKLDDFTAKFKEILTYVEKLNELDVEHVEPTYHVIPVTDTMRDDIERESMPADRVLKNAPERKEDFFRVPRVVE